MYIKLLIISLSSSYIYARNNIFKTFFSEHLLSQVSLLIYSDFRSSRLQMFFKIIVLKNFAILTEKHVR